jgi:general secretion pathway protein D
LVITPQAEYLREASTWVQRLDSTGGESLHVYNVQNGKADYLATVLNAVFGGGPGAAPTPPSGQVAPGLESVQLSAPSSAEQTMGSEMQSGAKTSPLSLGTSLSGKAPSQSGKPSSGTVRAAELGKIGEQVRVVADTENNALLIWANDFNYEKIMGALHKLDVTRRQVLVEATIAEVTLSGALQYGLQWYFKNGVGDYTGLGSLDLKTNVKVDNVLGNGFAYAITDSSNFVRALFKTLASESKLRVLSSPQLMVIDNQEAKILVGTQQPVQGPQSVTTGIVTTSIQYKDTGVLLQVRPQINAGGLVTMDISQQVTDVGPIDAATGQRSFDQRTITSRVAVQSGQSIFLGGLIRDRQTDSNRGIPVLYKLPVVGALFGSVDNIGNRTELVVLLTPRVVENNKDAQEVLKSLREKMKAVAPLVGNS